MVDRHAGRHMGRQRVLFTIIQREFNSSPNMDGDSAHRLDDRSFSRVSYTGASLDCKGDAPGNSS